MNLIFGKVVEINQFKELFLSKENFIKAPLATDVLFSSLKKLRNKLLKKDPIYFKLLDDLKKRNDIDPEEAEGNLQVIIDFIAEDNLRLKLKREFKTEYPFELKRISLKEKHFEAWYPLGVLVHVTPNNSPLLSVLGVIEGLLSANVNLLKLARKDTNFSVLFFKELIDCDDSHLLSDYLIIGRVSSKDNHFITAFFNQADVASVWGNEESIKNIKQMFPAKTRVVEWGHKISFSFFSKKTLDDDQSFKKLAFEICNNEQLACSSPQCVFVEDANFEILKKFGHKLNAALKEVSPTIKQILPEGPELAELTVTKELVRLESYFQDSFLIEAEDQAYRIYIDMKEGLEASPLFRTIWVKPLAKNNIVKMLRPLKQYLQTVGLVCKQDEVVELTQLFFQSGVQRIKALKEMTDSYMGEPHDGEYALLRYCQRVTFSDDSHMSKMASFEPTVINFENTHSKIMTKTDFQNAKVEDRYAELFFHSGGSSGEPKLSVFTYDDYHRQMELAAEGLYAAGLDPKTDRCMNLFYAGNLYGGFVSFFTILEKMEAIHFPMGGTAEFEMVANTIIKNKVNTILGMPSYIMQLFTKNHDLLKKNKSIKKVFYGGEHMSLSQRNFLKSEFGVEIIRSASYGSVDGGPLGFQCEYSEGTIHHLHERLHSLEVVELEEDARVRPGEVGRLLFSSKVRHGQNIIRYEIGDVGRIVSGSCQCGRKGTRFELLGRTGDVFRIGTIFFSYQKFQRLLNDYFEFEGSIQLQLFPGMKEQKEKIQLFVEEIIKQKTNQDLKKFFLEKYFELNEVVNLDKVLDFEVVLVSRDQLIFNKNTGKLKSVIDNRVHL